MCYLKILGIILGIMSNFGGRTCKMLILIQNYEKLSVAAQIKISCTQFSYTINASILFNLISGIYTLWFPDIKILIFVCEKSL